MSLILSSTCYLLNECLIAAFVSTEQLMFQILLSIYMLLFQRAFLFLYIWYITTREKGNSIMQHISQGVQGKPLNMPSSECNRVLYQEDKLSHQVIEPSFCIKLSYYNYPIITRSTVNMKIFTLVLLVLAAVTLASAEMQRSSGTTNLPQMKSNLTKDETCPSGYYACTDSLGGCCPNGHSCTDGGFTCSKTTKTEDNIFIGVGITVAVLGVGLVVVKIYKKCCGQHHNGTPSNGGRP